MRSALMTRSGESDPSRKGYVIAMKTTSPRSGRAKGAAVEIESSSIKEVAGTVTGGDVIEMVPLVMTLKEILVPIDFSRTALQALNYAVPLAKQFGARITLVHVVELPRTNPRHRIHRDRRF
jgi:hypothetical protein